MFPFSSEGSTGFSGALQLVSAQECEVVYCVCVCLGVKGYCEEMCLLEVVSSLPVM